MNVQGIKYEICGENCRIIDSWRYKDKSLMAEFVELHLTTAPFNRRSIKSYLREWRAHNLLYKIHIAEESTRDTDLNVNEKLIRRIGYFLLSPLYSLFN